MDLMTTEPDEQKESGAATSRMSHVRWTICAMLFFATSINYMDRQVIAILKPTLHQAIGLTEVNYGYIVLAFQLAYAIGVLGAGRLIDKLGTRLGYCVFMAIWSLSAMGHSLANSVLEFGVARFFLGLGESGNFPAAIKAVAEWFPQRERSLATGIFNSGANVGAILAPAIVPWVALRYSWRAAFLITGAFSALWIIWWFRYYRKPADHRGISGAELRHIQEGAAAQAASGETGPAVRWLSLLGRRQTWAFAVGKFMTDPIWWFFLFWLPSYFSSKFHLSLSHLGLPLIIIYTMSSVGSIFGGWLPVPFIKLGLKPTNARLTVMLLCALAVVPVFTAGYLHSEWMAIALLSLATAAHQGWSANLFTTASDMFPKRTVAGVVGIGTSAGSIGGMIIAGAAGWILQLTHSYVPLFIIASCAYLVALFFIIVLAPGLKKAEFAA